MNLTPTLDERTQEYPCDWKGADGVVVWNSPKGFCEIEIVWAMKADYPKPHITPKWEDIADKKTAAAQPEPDPELEQIFNGLVKIWREATGGMSSTKRRFSHPTYKAILRLGPETVQYIIAELQQRPDWWFDALELLTKENPTKPTDSFEDAANAWVEWWNNRID
jgi:hypothetical protein